RLFGYGYYFRRIRWRIALLVAYNSRTKTGVITRMKALVFGATGLIGEYLVNELLGSSAWKEVVVAGRSVLPIQHAKLKQVSVDFSNFDKHPELFHVDAVFSCLGTKIGRASCRV